MTPIPLRIDWYSIGLVVYRARRAVHALIFIQQSIVQSLRVRLLITLTAPKQHKFFTQCTQTGGKKLGFRRWKNNVIDCNIELLGLNSKHLPAKRKLAATLRGSRPWVQSGSHYDNFGKLRHHDVIEMPSAGHLIIWIEMDTFSDIIWRTSDQIFSIDSSCARLASSYWDPEVEIWRRI